ncbi:MAG: aminotransferase class I/II-fold pyridoxal phosphate-dependent enzyme [Clostridia bacterium]|nr:aminotransferase class I/II-fold pyridoxal phosphate-dependent enzyme [Clostridia bacterium]
MDQNRAPLAEALKHNSEKQFVPFDVPGHKGNLDFLADYYGKTCLAVDMNSRLEIDCLCRPDGCIKEAEALAAEAFGAKRAWFMVGGTTSAIQAMIMSVCTLDEKILLPRNVHSSVINAVILSGAIPVYINPTIHEKLGISLGMECAQILECIRNNPDAKAIVINNPIYYGICSDLKKIVDIAHASGMFVLVDEAHGAHFGFCEDLPVSAMACGADMSAVSMHKTGGSLTQSSLLLASDAVDADHVLETINISRTTSASYLLLSSLDLARRYLAQHGRQRLKQILDLANQARNAINEIDGLYAFTDEISDKDDAFDFDRTKLAVYTAGIGLAGIEVYDLLRDRFGVQIEFGDMNNILAIGGIGDREAYYETLVSSLCQIAKEFGKQDDGKVVFEYIKPTIRMSPRKAFFSTKEYLPLRKAVGKICSGSVMCYPPGIPILAPGELITEEIKEHIEFALDKGCSIHGLASNGCIQTVK